MDTSSYENSEQHPQNSGAPSLPSLPSLRNITPNQRRHSINQMMASQTGSYQGWIRSIDDHEKAMKEYFALNDCQQGNCTDFPTSNERQRRLIKTLFEAALDTSQAYEPLNAHSVKRIQRGAFTDVEYELVLWPLLISIRESQKGHCQLAHYKNGKNGKNPNVYLTFTERFDAVMDALRSSKDLVLSLFKDATYAHRLAWRPEAELRSKVTNRKFRDREGVQYPMDIPAAIEDIEDIEDIDDIDGIPAAIENDIKAEPNVQQLELNVELPRGVKKRSATPEGEPTANKRNRYAQPEVSPEPGNIELGASFFDINMDGMDAPSRSSSSQFSHPDGTLVPDNKPEQLAAQAPPPQQEDSVPYMGRVQENQRYGFNMLVDDGEEYLARDFHFQTPQEELWPDLDISEFMDFAAMQRDGLI
ncbi:hypothetical protein F4677DRAFT_445938 [Hypoxylon crocopeplum]|nr:hypothetical protein F4677DRAFT_445938 [Hypoxylon crocopeplum]